MLRTSYKIVAFCLNLIKNRPVWELAAKSQLSTKIWLKIIPAKHPNSFTRYLWDAMFETKNTTTAKPNRPQKQQHKIKKSNQVEPGVKNKRWLAKTLVLQGAERSNIGSAKHLCITMHRAPIATNFTQLSWFAPRLAAQLCSLWKACPCQCCVRQYHSPPNQEGKLRQHVQHDRDRKRQSLHKAR